MRGDRLRQRRASASSHARADLRARHRPLRGDASTSTASPTCSAATSSTNRHRRVRWSSIAATRRIDSHGTRASATASCADGDALALLDPRPAGARRRRGAIAYAVRRSRNHGAERRRRHGRVPGRLRLVRRAARSRSASSCSRATPPSARCSSAVGRVLRRGVAARHLQRQDVRRAGDGDALGCSTACAPPFDGLPHFDMLHAARRLWRRAATARRVGATSDGCRLGTLERVLCDVDARRRRARLRDSRALLPASCAAAMRGRSSRCSSTTGSTCSRWRRSRRTRVRAGRGGRGALPRRGRSARAGQRLRARRLDRSRDRGATSTRPTIASRARRRRRARRSTGWGCACGATAASRRRRTAGRACST